MSSGPRNVTTTTTNELPREFSGPISGALSAAQQDFAQRSGSGQDLIGQSSGLIGNTLAGNFLTPDANPFLQQTFNRAADLTRGRLDTEFAGSGRNLGASIPARSQELQTLASNIFGQNFQAERDRQTNAIGQSLGFDPTNMLINRIGGLIPGAGGTTTSNQPVHNDRFGQLAGLAATIAPFFMMSDRRVKENIKRIGTLKGYPFYAFEYKWGGQGVGVMSDEIPDEFVHRFAGIDHVDYGGLLR